MLCGSTFLIPAPGSGPTPHLWIVVTETGTEGRCIVVNVTTLRRGADQTLTLRLGDHPFVRHASVMNYAQSRITTEQILSQQEINGAIEQREPCGEALLRDVRAGFSASPFTPRKILEFFNQNR